jgi:MFS family permease
MSTLTQAPTTTIRTTRRGIAATPEPRGSGPHGVAFWLAAVAFLVNMGMSAVPTPIYPLYQQRDGFSNLMITVIYGVYAIGVVVSLFFAGHLSDAYGRRRVFIPALLINALSGVIFILAPSLAGLLVARVISGISVGLTTATATSYLAELHAKHRPSAGTRRADVVATAANLGGIGFGPLIAGIFVQLLPIPLKLSYIVFATVLVVLAVALSFAPETVTQVEPRPRYRPQRIAVPAAARSTFFAATAAGLAAFAVFGVFNSLVPSFLAGTLHNTSHIVAGAAAFAPFAAAAVAQIVQAQTDSLTLLRRAVPAIVVGLAMFAGAMWANSLVLFLAGGVVTGVGAGMVFKGALVVTVSTAPAGARAEVLAGYFLGAYVGLSVPVIGLGLATNYWAAKDVMLVFVVLAAAAIAASVSAVLRLNSRSR